MDTLAIFRGTFDDFRPLLLTTIRWTLANLWDSVGYLRVLLSASWAFVNLRVIVDYFGSH